MDLRENLLICIGSPMIDVTARIPHDFLQKYKLKPNNAISYNEYYAELFSDLGTYKPTFTVGGSITHAIRSMQTLLRHPGVCCYLGAVGKDNFGKEICQKLKEDGINVLFEEIENEGTSKCAALLFEDNRSFVTDLGASRFLSEGFLEKDEVWNAVSRGKYYYMSAFFFPISWQIVWKICRHASKENKIFIFNIGAPFLCSKYAEEFKKVLPCVKVLFGNEEEALHLASSLGHHNRNIRAVASFLRTNCYKQTNGEESDDTLVVVTRGNKPVVLADKGEIREFEVPRLQVHKKLNTSGAGDYFVGGFLANYVQDKSIEECMRGGLELSSKLIEENSLKY